MNRRHGVSEGVGGMGELRIKGTAFALARNELAAALERGHLRRDELSERLSTEELALVEAEPDPASWVPVSTYERVLRILLDVEGGGDPDYLVRCGERGFDAVLDTPMHRQLRRFEEEDAAGEVGWFERAGHSLVTLPSVIFSEGSWKLSKGNGDRVFTLAGEGLGRLPMNVARLVEGAIQSLASRLAGRAIRVTTQQPDEGRIRFLGSEA